MLISVRLEKNFRAHAGPPRSALIGETISTWAKRPSGQQTLCHFRAIRDGCSPFSVHVKLCVYSIGQKRWVQRTKRPEILLLTSFSSDIACVSPGPPILGPVIISYHGRWTYVLRSANRHLSAQGGRSTPNVSLPADSRCWSFEFQFGPWVWGPILNKLAWGGFWWCTF